MEQTMHIKRSSAPLTREHVQDYLIIRFLASQLQSRNVDPEVLQNGFGFSFLGGCGEL